MRFRRIFFSWLMMVSVCVMPVESARAQAQPSPSPEHVTPPAKKKPKARPAKNPSKELQAIMAKEGKRQAQATKAAQAARAEQEKKARVAAQAKAKASAIVATPPAVIVKPAVIAQPQAGIVAVEKPVVDAQQKPAAVANETLPVAEGVQQQVEKSTEARAPAKRRKKIRVAEVKYDYLIGVAGVKTSGSGKAVQFGKFTGVTDNKVYLIGSADIQSRNGRRYWNLKADNIGLDNRSFNFDGGTIGKYKLHFGYSELDNLLSANSQTPFNGAGEESLTLPAGFTRASSTTGMTDLAASMQNVELGTQRKEGDASLSFGLGQNVGLSFSFRRYLKDGIKSIGAVVLPDFNGAQGLVLPEPVNYHTDEFTTGLDWHGERGQADLEYYYSRFNNNNTSLTWDNPYTYVTPQPYPAMGQTSLPPDNQHQRLSLSGSYQLAETTRASVLYERGSMTQNETFLPYTINPVSAITTPLPRTSADARIDTTLVKFDLAMQPLPALSLHADYRHYKADNRTPRDLYQMVVNDTFDQVALNEIAAQYNQPVDSDQTQLKLDGSWYFGQGATFKLGLDQEKKKYHYRAVNETKEKTVSARLNKRWDAGATAYLDLARGRRRADNYDSTPAFENLHTSQYLATLAANEYFDSLPAMRQFDIADRDRDRQGLGITLLPSAELAVGMNANRNNDKYNTTQFGLQARETRSITLDTTLTPDEYSSWSFYYTRQDAAWRQAGRAYTWAQKPARASDPANDWSARHKDVIDTVGINITMSFLDDALPVRLAYAYSNMVTNISFTADAASAVNTPPLDMPALRGKRHTLDLSGNYAVRDNLSVRVGAMVEFYRSSDWATDGLPPGSPVAPEVLTLSGSATPYHVVLLTTALNYHF